MNKNQIEIIGLNIERLEGIENEIESTDWSEASPQFKTDLKLALLKIKEAKEMLHMAGNRLIKR